MTKYFSPFDRLPRDCWVSIDTQQLTENVRLLQKEVSVPVLVAVKANGYGHGYDHAASAFVEGGASYLGVANLAEALLIKSLGLGARILILGALLPHDIQAAAAADIEFMVFTKAHLDALRTAPKQPHPIRVHIKVDTGMGRLGCFPHEVASLGLELAHIPGVHIAGMATHFAMSNASESAFTEYQLAQFQSAVVALADNHIRPEILHPAKSSGGLYYPAARFDMVRLGIAAYGVPPANDKPMPAGVKTAFTWHARITASKILPADAGVSYSREYIMPKEGRVGILPVGYADGFRRTPKNINSVLVDGRECKVLGRVNMDQIMIDLGDMPDMTGAEAVLLGKQSNTEISVQELAKRWNTNTYDVMTGTALRVPRKIKL